MRGARQAGGQRVRRGEPGSFRMMIFIRHQSSDKKRPVSMNATGLPGGDENISDNERIAGD